MWMQVKETKIKPQNSNFATSDTKNTSQKLKEAGGLLSESTIKRFYINRNDSLKS